MQRKKEEQAMNEFKITGIEDLPKTELVRRCEDLPIDPENPYAPIHAGRHKGRVAGLDGTDHSYEFYIPSNEVPGGPTVYVFCPSGITAAEFFDKYHWQRRLEAYATAGCFLEAPDGCDLQGSGMEWISQIFQEMRDGQFYSAGEQCLSVIGIGDGAYPAAVFSLRNSGTLASFAVCGNKFPALDVLETIGELPTERVPEQKRKESAIPAYVISEDLSENAEELIQYLKKANHVSEEEWHLGETRVYRQKRAGKAWSPDDAAVSEVWIGVKDAQEEEIQEEMLKFVRRFRRWGNTGNGDIRRYRTPEDMGLVRHEMYFGGLKRHWYFYEPTWHKKHPEEKLPLVIAMHGFSASGLLFAEESGWSELAEERHFLVAFPTAYPFRRQNISPVFSMFALCPTWKSYPAEEKKESPDDVAFLCEMTDWLKRHYKVDESRIYVSGHSNGSVMTQALMRYAPHRFAAFAPIGAMELLLKEAEPLPEHEIKRPVWLIMGENDGAEGWSLESGTANDRTIRMLCEANETDYENAKHYVCGGYHHLVTYDKDQIPYLRFTGIAGWPHTVTPSSSRMIYDEFFCRFRRKEDGSSEYLG